MAILQTNDIFKTELSEGQHRLSPEEIHKVQQVVYGITIDITELCSELNIPYMLTGGTALGAVRHGGFIPWDDDVDMGVERKYIERLLDAIEQRMPDRYFVEAPLRTPGPLSSKIQNHRKNTKYRKNKEKPDICNAVGAHHDEVEMQTLLAPIVQVCDAISGARPGARREIVAAYIKRLNDLEQLALSYPGVVKTYAIQAGRELRVIVGADKIDDKDTENLSTEIAKRIQDEMTYPGQVKITVIRETRAVSYAK